MKKFSDFAQERTVLDGPKLPIDDVTNRDMVVTGYKIAKSKYGKNTSGMCLTLQFQFVGCDDKNVIFTGSDVLIEQMERYGEEVPFQTVIRKIDKYYTFA